MICLILGGTGVMGRHLVKLLEEDNHDVYVTSRKKIDSTSKTHYLTGNARDDGFLKYCVDEISKQESDKIDVIVDFMSYKTDEFAKKVDFLLNN
ncbi:MULTISPECIES: NAD-dependent epimerase/dehydratase family protein [Oscillospiraceae]|uniref:NAD-dependent epimerase/dehydratase family protein n=1 Tax=Oscillospiraceae TaxID=216572 RepID=UPI001105D4C3|nr:MULTISPECIES: NAD-dependent epimerase/dehydratase family protein [Oscillospiraceae]